MTETTRSTGEKSGVRNTVLRNKTTEAAHATPDKTRVRCSTCNQEPVYLSTSFLDKCTACAEKELLRIKRVKNIIHKHPDINALELAKLTGYPASYLRKWYVKQVSYL